MHGKMWSKQQFSMHGSLFSYTKVGGDKQWQVVVLRETAEVAALVLDNLHPGKDDGATDEDTDDISELDCNNIPHDFEGF